MIVESLEDGVVILGDCTDKHVFTTAYDITGLVPLITTDPPYGKIVKEEWDKTNLTDTQYAAWMLDWTRLWAGALHPNAAFYVWGGIGIPGFRPFIKYMSQVEEKSDLLIANQITWSKKRAYGIQHNYLFTREECVYLFNGKDIKKPRCFNVPLLDTKRGYAGYNKKYPAKSEFKRRTNVWTDITEIFRGKEHPTQKAQRLYEVMIEVHTEPGEYVVDMFAGAGTCAHAARKLGRRFLVIEKDKDCFDKVVDSLR